MVTREQLLLLPNSKKQIDGEGARLNMKKRHLWILGITFALIISWNILLTLQSLRTTHQHEFSQLIKALLAREKNEVKDFYFFKCFMLVSRSEREGEFRRLWSRATFLYGIETQEIPPVWTAIWLTLIDFGQMALLCWGCSKGLIFTKISYIYRGSMEIVSTYTLVEWRRGGGGGGYIS